MAPQLPAMVKFFTPTYITTCAVKRNGSFAYEKPGCLAIDRGQLVPIGQARSYVDKKDEEGDKPILELEDFPGIPSSMEQPRAENIAGKSMEKQEELKKKPDPKPDATDS